MKVDYDDVALGLQLGAMSDEPPHPVPHPAAARLGCPYLDTVARSLLDFDMPKLCSVTLSPQHVYACLVCGKYFEGRGRHTHAFTHSVDAGHHVFINVESGRVYCLPEGYEVLDASLDDVKFALHPRYSKEQIAALDDDHRLATDVLGATYLPGFVGLNNLKHTDYVNVVVMALSHVHELRNYFLDATNYAACPSPLVARFGELVRKLWSPAAFKATVSPIEFLTEVSLASKRRFGQVGVPTDAHEFLAWLLHALHEELIADRVPAGVAVLEAQAAAATGGGGARATAAGKRPRASAASSGRSIITDVFQGEVEVETLSSELVAAQEAETTGASGAAASSGTAATATPTSTSGAIPPPPRRRLPEVRRLPFLFISLDLPPTPLYKDDEGGRVVVQVPLARLLSKFDGATVTDSLVGQYRERKRYRITRLPPYLLLHHRRFARNTFFAEKNPTIVNFPVKNLEMRAYVSPEAAAGVDPITGAPLPPAELLATSSVAELRKLLETLSGGAAAARKSGTGLMPLEKSDLVAAARTALASASGTKYDLVANIVHDTPPESGTADPLASGAYRVHVRHGGAASGQWYEMQDLRVADTMPQLIAISESYILVYRRQGYVPRTAW